MRARGRKRSRGDTTDAPLESIDHSQVSKNYQPDTPDDRSGVSARAPPGAHFNRRRAVPRAPRRWADSRSASTARSNTVAPSARDAATTPPPALPGRPRTAPRCGSASGLSARRGGASRAPPCSSSSSPRRGSSSRVRLRARSIRPPPRFARSRTASPRRRAPRRRVMRRRRMGGSRFVNPPPRSSDSTSHITSTLRPRFRRVPAMASGLGPLRRTGRFLLSPRRSRLRPPSPRPLPPAESYCVRGKSSDCAPLSGLGVRVSRIAGVGVKVYACGLYVDVASALRALRRFGQPAGVARDGRCTRRFCATRGWRDGSLGVRARSGQFEDRGRALRRPTGLGAGSESLARSRRSRGDVSQGKRLTFSAVAGN